MMKKVRITALRRTTYPDLMALYENPIPAPCNIREGDTFLFSGEKPEGFCDSAWETLAPFVFSLAKGEGNFFDGWMKDPMTALLSCNDGFRPVSFLLAATEEDF